MVKRRIPAPRNILMSYHYFKDYDLDRVPNLTIIGDSGAFSAKSQGATITTKELADWAKQWRHRLKWVAALDVIGNPVATYSNWREMVDVHGVEAVPTIHYGTHPSELDKYARRGVDLVGLGGLVRVPTGAQMRWLIQVFKYAAKHHPDMQFHGWGCTSAAHFRLPFYSVDSSSWTSGVRYGQARLVDPRTGKQVAYKLDGGEAYRPGIARLLSEVYGVSPRDASYSNASNREVMIRIHALAESAREQWWRGKHGPARVPSWGVNPAAVRADQRAEHLAVSAGSDVEKINDIGARDRSVHLATTGPYFPQLDRMAGEEGAGERSVHLATSRGSNASPKALEETFYPTEEQQ